MNSTRGTWVAGALTTLGLAGLAEAQSPPAPLAPTVPPPAAAGGAGGLVLFVGLMLGLIVILGVSVKLMDWRRRRMEHAVQVQARIADALLLDPELVNAPITATVELPFWRRSPATIEVRGQAPSPRVRDAALNLVVREATASGMESRIEDRMAVMPAAGQRAA